MCSIHILRSLHDQQCYQSELSGLFLINSYDILTVVILRLYPSINQFS